MAYKTESGCPLCEANNSILFHKDRQRRYRCCTKCRLVFVPPEFWLDLTDEKAVYDLHRNDPEDTGYRQFLSRLSRPLLARLSPDREGLDFGCGPGPALARMLAAAGHRMRLYDPFYCDQPETLERTYDFITATEVVEHLRDPGSVFDTLFNLLRPGGWLGIMTKLVKDREAFARWHYIRDPTHICFFSRETFAYLADRYRAELNVIGHDVILLRKTREWRPH